MSGVIGDRSKTAYLDSSVKQKHVLGKSPLGDGQRRSSPSLHSCAQAAARATGQGCAPRVVAIRRHGV